MAAARARGRSGGRRPKLSADQAQQAQRLYDEGSHTVQQIADMFGVKRGTLYGYLNRPAASRTSAKRPRSAQPFRPLARTPAGDDGGRRRVILPKERDPRFITVRRGGSLTDADHRLLAIWAALCAEHVLHFFESERPSDHRPRSAIEAIRAWTLGEVKMMESRTAGGHAMGAARPLTGAARYAAYAAGQAGAVAHVAAHELGAAAYAIKAVRSAAPVGEETAAGRGECRWQREQLPVTIRELVLDDQRLRNEICWSVFEI